MKIVVNYFEPRSVTKPNKSGFGSYITTESVIVKTEEHLVETDEDKQHLFQTIYHRNNSLRYCNGSHWVFVDKLVEFEYRGAFMRKYNTISNYYGNGVVD